ncbi:unnamed protein product [Soboliphyme baturini]|uniref:Uncharacterized protein n=1 Tax=Soboliphyme baturini TaxID=241478 RepID=A0A183IB21_9BILA|nr:unnamed protein product [Soboliphyme baturini]
MTSDTRPDLALPAAWFNPARPPVCCAPCRAARRAPPLVLLLYVSLYPFCVLIRRRFCAPPGNVAATALLLACLPHRSQPPCAGATSLPLAFRLSVVRPSVHHFSGCSARVLLDRLSNRLRQSAHIRFPQHTVVNP